MPDRRTINVLLVGPALDIFPVSERSRDARSNEELPVVIEKGGEITAGQFLESMGMQYPAARKFLNTCMIAQDAEYVRRNETLDIGEGYKEISLIPPVGMGCNEIWFGMLNLG